MRGVSQSSISQVSCMREMQDAIDIPTASDSVSRQALLLHRVQVSNLRHSWVPDATATAHEGQHLQSAFLELRGMSQSMLPMRVLSKESLKGSARSYIIAKSGLEVWEVLQASDVPMQKLLLSYLCHLQHQVGRQRSQTT